MRSPFADALASLTASTYTVTTWKSRCARPTCRKPVAPLSKYCSDYCGIEVAATRLDLCGLDAEYFWPRVVGARRREAQVFDMKQTAVVPLQTDPDAEVNSSLMDDEASRRQEEEETRALKRLEEKIGQLVTRRESLDGKLFLVEARSQYLKIAIKRWEALCQATADTVAAEREEAEREEAERAKEEGEEEEEEEAEQDGEEEEPETPAAIKARERAKNKNKNKNKAKRRGTRRVANVGTGPTNIPEAQCGLDVRLVFDSAQWEEWVKSEEGREVLGKVEVEGGEGVRMDEEDMERVCLMPRKQCDRHTGWQKVREADFDTEKSVIVSRAVVDPLSRTSADLCFPLRRVVASNVSPRRKPASALRSPITRSTHSSAPSTATASAPSKPSRSRRR